MYIRGVKIKDKDQYNKNISVNLKLMLGEINVCNYF